MSSEQTSATGNPPPSDVNARLTKAELEISLLKREVSDLREALKKLAEHLPEIGP